MQQSVKIKPAAIGCRIYVRDKWFENKPCVVMRITEDLITFKTPSMSYVGKTRVPAQMADGWVSLHIQDVIDGEWTSEVIDEDLILTRV